MEGLVALCLHPYPSTYPSPALFLLEESPLICYLTVGSKQVNKQKENRLACGLSMVDQKKSPRSGYVSETARSPLGIFSSNDIQSLPPEEREESKEVQGSKGKGIFFVGGQTGEDCLPYLTDGLKSRVCH